MPLPRIFGPKTGAGGAEQRDHDDEDDRRSFGPQLADQPPERTPEVLGLLDRHRHAAHGPEAAAAAPAAEAAGPPARRVPGLDPSAVRSRVSACWPAHATSSRVSCEYTISRYVSQVFISSACVPMPATLPPSRTTIWSACRIVPDSLGDDDHRRVRGLLSERRSELRSVLKSSAEKLSSKM